jgi:predicted DNA-binding ribbon-helix-helix protein
MATGSNYSLRLPAGWHKPGLLPMVHLRGREAVKSSVSKRSIVIAGHKTSVSLEDEFWKSLKEIARERSMTLAQLVAVIDGNRQHPNLSSAIRLFVLGVYRDQRR